MVLRVLPNAGALVYAGLLKSIGARLGVSFSRLVSNNVFSRNQCSKNIYNLGQTFDKNGDRFRIDQNISSIHSYSYVVFDR